MSKRKRTYKRKPKGLKIAILFCIFICGIVFYQKNSLEAESTKYQKQIKDLNKKIKEEEKRSKEIKEYQDYVKTDKYIEEVARQKLGLVYKDEIILKPKE